MAFTANAQIEIRRIHPLSIEAIVLALVNNDKHSYVSGIHPLSIEAIVLAQLEHGSALQGVCIHPLSIEAIVLARILTLGQHLVWQVSILYQSRLSFWLQEAIKAGTQNIVSILYQSRLSFWHPGHAPAVWILLYPSSINRGYRSGNDAYGSNPQWYVVSILYQSRLSFWRLRCAWLAACAQ